MTPTIVSLRTGGQTGTDRAALHAARAVGLPVVGWCPRGGWAEDLTEAPGIRAEFPELTETPSAKVEQRTAWNARDSHVTLVVTTPERAQSPGTNFTVASALRYGRPNLTVSYDDDPKIAARWVAEQGRGLCLNVGGPRESEAPGLHDKAYAYLVTLFELLGPDYGDPVVDGD